MVSFVFHGAIILILFYFAAREGLLGKQLKTIAVHMVTEKPPDEPKESEAEPEQPAQALPPVETPQLASPVAPVETPPPVQQTPAPAVSAPPAYAPPAVQMPSFAFEGGRIVQTSSDPAQIYKGFVESALRSKWNRPVGLADHGFVAEVELAIDRAGRLSEPEWKKSSGNPQWDDSVRAAIATTSSVNRAPPTNFPARVLIRFDALEVVEEVLP
jgi:outer membrane biosynthesis protein TonB